MSNISKSYFRLPFCVMLVCSSIGAVLTNVGVAPGQEVAAWEVRNKLLGKPKDPPSQDSKKSEDVSGIACAASTGFPRICLVVDDESQGAQVVILRDGELIAGDFIRLIHDDHDGELLELDAEGVAYEDGAFYVAGSHGRPRHQSEAAEEEENKAKAQASRRVFRIRFAADAVDPETGKVAVAPEVSASTELIGFINSDAKLKAWFDKPLDDNGLTIEGVAVRDRTLHVGMRGPVLEDGSAVVLSVPLGAVFDGQAGEAKLHPVGLGADTLGKPRGIRDIASFGSGFLFLAGPVSDPPQGHDIKLGDYSIFSWDKNTVANLLNLKAYGSKTKPEALLPLDRKDDQARILLLFDGPDEGEPRPVELKVR